MKIARFTEGGRTRLGIVTIDTGEVIDVGSADTTLPTDVGHLLAGDGLVALARTAATAPRLPLTADSTIVFVGDYIDRGPLSFEVVEQGTPASNAIFAISGMGSTMPKG